MQFTKNPINYKSSFTVCLFMFFSDATILMKKKFIKILYYRDILLISSNSLQLRCKQMTDYITECQSTYFFSLTMAE